MSKLTDILHQLDENPSNWDLRLRAVEEFTTHNRLEQARALVRNSPEGPVPYHVQTRLWDILSGDSEIRVIEEGELGKKPLLVAKARVVRNQNPGQQTVVQKPAPSQIDGILKMPQRDVPSLKPEDGAPLKLAKIKIRESKPIIAAVNLATFEDGKLPKPAETRAGSSQFSAVTMAIMAHLLILLLFMFVTVSVPLLVAPQFSVIPAPPLDDDVVKKQIVQKVTSQTPAAPSMAAANVLVAPMPSPLSIPKIESDAMKFDANLFDVGFGNSMGVSFEGEGAESAVSFFGIEGGGRRIAFIVDATPSMLLDEKGGMFSYNKVKNEIAAMLSTLNSGTAFNLFVYEGKKLAMFRDEPVRAMKLNVIRAKEWLEPINRNVQRLGLRDNFTMEGVKKGAQPINERDIAHYSKAIQAALEQDVQAIFCICSGWGSLRRSLSPEDQKRYDEAMAEYRAEVEQMDIEVTYDPQEVARWQRAVEKARTWLEKENQARKDRGMAPKVVLNFGDLIRELSPGARPPQAQRSQEPPPAPSLSDLRIERPPAYTPDEVLDHLNNVVTSNYGRNKPDRPQIHLVLFLGEKEDIGQYEEHFVTLTRRNRGQLKLLRGFAALENVSGS